MWYIEKKGGFPCKKNTLSAFCPTEHLNKVIKKLKGSGHKVRRAHILLKTDADGQNWTDQQIGEAFSCRIKTVENIRQRFVQQGFQQTLDGKKREQPPTPKLLNGEQFAPIIAMRLGPPPPGYASFPLRLLACWVIELEIVDSISHETLRQTLKKNGMTQRKIAYWVIPPDNDAEFVANILEF
jgi:hypothetical protein